MSLSLILKDILLILYYDIDFKWREVTQRVALILRNNYYIVLYHGVAETVAQIFMKKYQRTSVR